MVETGDVIGAVLIGLVFTGVIAFGVAGVSLPGTVEGIDLPFLDDTAGQAEGKCTLETEITVEGTTLGATLNRDSFRTFVSPTGVFGYSLVGGTGVQAITGADNVEIQFTLNGPIDSSIQTRKDVADEISALGSEQVSFKATNLPPGEYVLHHNLFWKQGDAYERFDVTIPAGCGQ